MSYNRHKRTQTHVNTYTHTKEYPRKKTQTVQMKPSCLCNSTTKFYETKKETNKKQQRRTYTPPWVGVQINGKL